MFLKDYYLNKSSILFINMTQLVIENIEWIRSVGCVLYLDNPGDFPLFADAIIFNGLNGSEKCRGFVAVLREDADKCEQKGIIRATIRLDTTQDIPAKGDIILLTLLNLE